MGLHIFFAQILRRIKPVVPLQPQAASGHFGKLADGVTGNTSDFGSEESRFEPWSANNVAK